MYKFLLNCPEPPTKKTKNKRGKVLMSRSGDWIVVYNYNNRTEKLLKLEPKKIQQSDENLRAELTHILLTRQHNA